jgi:hypothetical protein
MNSEEELWLLRGQEILIRTWVFRSEPECPQSGALFFSAKTFFHRCFLRHLVRMLECCRALLHGRSPADPAYHVTIFKVCEGFIISGIRGRRVQLQETNDRYL